MPRELPILMRQKLEAESSDDAALFFVSIRHEALDGEIRLVTDGVDYDFEGETWHKSWFELTPPTDTEGPPTSKFVFPNVDRRATNLLERVTEPVVVRFRIFSASWFDLSVAPRAVRSGSTPTPALDVKHQYLIDIKADPLRVEGKLRAVDYRREAWPARRVTQEDFPGTFLA